MQARGPVLSTRFMADSSKTQSLGRRLLKWLILILLADVCGLGVALFFMAQPQDLTDLAGSGPPLKSAPARDLKAVLQNAIDRGYPLTLTETEINQWLGRTLVAKQGGLLAGIVSLERVWVRLEDGHAEVVMVRKIMGQPFTVSMFLKVEQSQGPNGTLDRSAAAWGALPCKPATTAQRRAFREVGGAAGISAAGDARV